MIPCQPYQTHNRTFLLQRPFLFHVAVSEPLLINRIRILQKIIGFVTFQERFTDGNSVHEIFFSLIHVTALHRASLCIQPCSSGSQYLTLEQSKQCSHDGFVNYSFTLWSIFSLKITGMSSTKSKLCITTAAVSGPKTLCIHIFRCLVFVFAFIEEKF